MKALNRAIARTVSQLARQCGEGSHPLMANALVIHLQELLKLEYRQLEQAGISHCTLDWQKTENFGGFPVAASEFVITGCRRPGRATASAIAQAATLPGDEQAASSMMGELARTQAERPPAPDAIDMTDPANWQEGDVLLRTGEDWANFETGNEYLVMNASPERQKIFIAPNYGAPWTGYTFDLLKEGHLFQWLRHGEAL